MGEHPAPMYEGTNNDEFRYSIISGSGPGEGTSE